MDVSVVELLMNKFQVEWLIQFLRLLKPERLYHPYPQFSPR